MLTKSNDYTPNTDDAGNTELHTAAKNLAHGQISIEMFSITLTDFILNEFNPNLRNHQGESVLDIAIQHQATDLINLLLTFDGVTLGESEEEIRKTLSAIKAIPMKESMDVKATKYNNHLKTAIRLAEEKIAPRIHHAVLFSPSKAASNKNEYVPSSLTH